MQLHKLTCSYISLRADTWACMQLHELACSSFLRLSSSQEFRSACWKISFLASVTSYGRYRLVPNRGTFWRIFYVMSEGGYKLSFIDKPESEVPITFLPIQLIQWTRWIMRTRTWGSPTWSRKRLLSSPSPKSQSPKSQSQDQRDLGWH